MLVEGAILDVNGARRGYVRFRGGRLTETGKLGTDSSHGREPRLRGIVIPSPVNGHTHLGDAVSVREPPAGPLSRLVGAPGGYKFRLLANTPRPEKVRAIRAALARMARAGVAATIDFREEGLEGVRIFREAARGSPVRAVLLGRPLSRPPERAETAALLRESDGIGLSSAGDLPGEVRRSLVTACHAAGKRIGWHASEAVREPPERYLEPRPDLLVHLAKATPADLAEVREAGVTVAVCPRSNALFGRQPDLRTMERLGLPIMLGTDNAMFHSPSIWRELEFAYVGSRLRHRPVSADYLARSALVEPWRWLGEPEAARIEPGSPARPLVLRLPPDDPAYQVVTRATEHLMVRPGPRGPGRALSG